MIRNIIFDMGHVLMWYEAAGGLPQRCSRRRGRTRRRCARRSSAGQLWVEVDHGRLDGEAFTGAVKALLTMNRLHAAVDTIYQGMPENILIPVEGMAAVVDRCSEPGIFRCTFCQTPGKFMSRRRT